MIVFLDTFVIQVFTHTHTHIHTHIFKERVTVTMYKEEVLWLSTLVYIEVCVPRKIVQF